MAQSGRKRTPLEKKMKILEEFCVPLTEDVLDTLKSLEGKDVPLDRYVKDLIKKSMFKGENDYE